MKPGALELDGSSVGVALSCERRERRTTTRGNVAKRIRMRLAELPAFLESVGKGGASRLRRDVLELERSDEAIALLVSFATCRRGRKSQQRAAEAILVRTVLEGPPPLAAAIERAFDRVGKTLPARARLRLVVGGKP